MVEDLLVARGIIASHQIVQSRCFNREEALAVARS